MTVSSEILECIEVDYLNDTAKIKDNVPDETVKEIKLINEIYKKSYGKYLWKFKD